ncbi:hypothetical protein [Marinobacterium aestuariivivens]|uniref:Uncharacterized protein n=1 Tax=Marinobacterium aestuariivivens TaxID=1698799 RepID=A0ABW2A619_9GAMM
MIALFFGLLWVQLDGQPWLPYRDCGIDIGQPRSALTFSFSSEQVSAFKETTFLTQRK